MISRRFFEKNRRSITLSVVGFFLVLAATVVLVIWKRDWFWPSGEKPEPEIILSRLPDKIKLGETYPVAMSIINRGGDGLNEEAAFSGLHIEVKNAKVKNIRSASPASDSQVVIKPTAQRGDIYWFEVKYDFLPKGQWGMVLFDLTPNNPDQGTVDIWYRGWAPAFCSLAQRWEGASSLVGKYETFAQGWRNEDCIIRRPVNNSQNEESCQIDVYAAHGELQVFRCFKKVIDREPSGGV